jgi:hypothetical protein
MSPAAIETAEAKAARYERTLRAIKDCTLTGVDFGDWVQAACEDALDGLEPECYNCGTFVHAGPCVAEDKEPE